MLLKIHLLFQIRQLPAEVLDISGMAVRVMQIKLVNHLVQAIQRSKGTNPLKSGRDL